MDTTLRAIDRLKEVVSICPMLALPDFTQPFVLECDASGEGDAGHHACIGQVPVVFGR